LFNFNHGRSIVSFNHRLSIIYLKQQAAQIISYTYTSTIVEHFIGFGCSSCLNTWYL